MSERATKTCKVASGAQVLTLFALRLKLFVSSYQKYAQVLAGSATAPSEQHNRQALNTASTGTDRHWGVLHICCATKSHRCPVKQQLKVGSSSCSAGLLTALQEGWTANLLTLKVGELATSVMSVSSQCSHAVLALRISRQAETQFSAMFYSLLAHHSGKSNFQGVPMAPREPWLAEALHRGASLSPLMFSGEQRVAGHWLCWNKPEIALISAMDEIGWTDWDHGAAETI